MDLQKSAPSRLSLWPICGQDVASPIIEGLVDIFVAPGVYRIIFLNIWATPTCECGWLPEEGGETFFGDGIAAKVDAEDFEGFGVLIKLAPRHHLALL